MELKVLCGCGQKIKFDVEPVNGQMPYQVNCPVCNADATQIGNAAMAEKLALNPTAATTETSAPPPVITPVSGGSRISPAATIALPGMAVSADDSPPPGRGAVPKQPPESINQPKPSSESKLVLGVLGAVLGAGLGAALMYGFFMFANFRFPIMGTCIGLLTGFGARFLYKGKNSILGGISAAIAVLATCGTLFLMYGELQGLIFISIGVSGYFAYRIAG